MSKKNIIHLALVGTGIVFAYHLSIVSNVIDWLFLITGCLFVFSLIILFLRNDISTDT